MSADVICIRNRERIAADTERLHFMRQQQRRVEEAELAERMARLAEMIAFYRAHGARHHTVPLNAAKE